MNSRSGTIDMASKKRHTGMDRTELQGTLARLLAQHFPSKSSMPLSSSLKLAQFLGVDSKKPPPCHVDDCQSKALNEIGGTIETMAGALLAPHFAVDLGWTVHKLKLNTARRIGKEPALLRLTLGHGGPELGAGSDYLQKYAFSDGFTLVAFESEIVPAWKTLIDDREAILADDDGESNGGFVCVAVTPDEHQIAAGSWNGTVYVWSMRSGVCQLKFKASEEAILSIATLTVSKSRQNTRCIITGSVDGVARIWDIDTGDLVSEYRGHADAITCILTTPVKPGHVFTGSADHTIQLWRDHDGEQLQSFEGHYRRVLSMDITADGTRLVTASADDLIAVWDVATGQQIKTTQPLPHDCVVGLKCDPEQNAIFFVADTYRIYTMDLEKFVLKQIGCNSSHSSIVLAQDHIVTATATNRSFGISVISKRINPFGLARHDIANRRDRGTTLRLHYEEVSSVAATKKFIVSASMDGTVRVYDFARLQQ